MKLKCKNGNTVERWYDRKTRSSVTVVMDTNHNQLGEAEYDGNKKSAAFSLAMMVKANGGLATDNKALAGTDSTR